jgi:hypothetical protein
MTFGEQPQAEDTEEDEGYELTMQPERRHARAAKPPAAAVTAEALAQQLAATQAAGSAAAQGVLQQLRKRFVPSSLMEAYGLVQPQYSLAPNPEERCKRDLEVLIAKYGEERSIEQAAPAAAPAVGSRAAATAAAAAESAAEEAVAAAAAVRQEHLAGLTEQAKWVRQQIREELQKLSLPGSHEAGLQKLLQLVQQLTTLETVCAAA